MADSSHGQGIIPQTLLELTKQINDYLDNNGNDSALKINANHGITPLHMLLMNPRAPVEPIVSLLKVNTKAANMAHNIGKPALLLYFALQLLRF